MYSDVLFSPGFSLGPGPSMWRMHVYVFSPCRSGEYAACCECVGVSVSCAFLRFLMKYLENINLSLDKLPATFLIHYLAVIRNDTMLHEQ